MNAGKHLEFLQKRVYWYMYMDSQDAGSRFKHGLFAHQVYRPANCQDPLSNSGRKIQVHEQISGSFSKSRLCKAAQADIRSFGFAYLLRAGMNICRVCQGVLLKHGGFNVRACSKENIAFFKKSVCSTHAYLNDGAIHCTSYLRYNILCIIGYGGG